MDINSTASKRVSSTSADTTLLDLHNGDKALSHVAMVALFLDLNNLRCWKYGRKKKQRKKCMYDFPVHGCTRREQNGSPDFSSNVWRLCQERLLRSRNFSAITTWRHISAFFSSDYNEPYPIIATYDWMFDVKHSATQTYVFSLTLRKVIALQPWLNLCDISNFQVAFKQLALSLL